MLSVWYGIPINKRSNQTVICCALYFHRPKLDCLVRTPDLKRQFSLISPSNRKLSPNLPVIFFLWRIHSALKHLLFLYKKGKVRSSGTLGRFPTASYLRNSGWKWPRCLRTGFSFLFEGFEAFKIKLECNAQGIFLKPLLFTKIWLNPGIGIKRKIISRFKIFCGSIPFEILASKLCVWGKYGKVWIWKKNKRRGEDMIGIYWDKWKYRVEESHTGWPTRTFRDDCIEYI